LNRVISNNQKTGKTGSRLQNSEVLINTVKQQNQTNFCSPKILIIYTFLHCFKTKN